MTTEKLDSRLLKAEALRLGFSRIGLAPAEPVAENVMADYERWLREGRQAGMHYLENHLALRHHPALLLPGAATVVSVALSYHPGDRPTQPGIAWYAQGRDYHDVLRERLRRLVAAVSPHAPLTSDSYRICVDTAPLPEKYWAWRCGLGWIGRNRQLVIPHEGSAFFLAELLLTCEADRYDIPLTPHPLPGGDVPGCGNCRRCLEACPTGALTEDGLDARRCLSYLTIEHRDALPDEVAPHLRDCFYGCDRCLRACPHLSRALPSAVEEFRPSPLLLAMSPTDWEQLSPDTYKTLFRGSAVKRVKYEGLMRNIRLSRRPPSDD